jgi:hypothetical protein
VPIDYAQMSNVFVDSIFLENPFVIGGEKNSIHVRLRNEGPRTLEGLITKLTINGIQAGTSSVTIQANSSTETTFDLSRGLTGYNKAILSFSDFPVSFDNEFYFTLNYSGRLRVIEIKPNTRITSVENVYGNRALFDFRGYAVDNVDYSVLSAADLVVVNGIDKIDNSLNAALQIYRNNGGAMLVVPGKQPDQGVVSKFVRHCIAQLRLLKQTKLSWINRILKILFLKMFLKKDPLPWKCRGHKNFWIGVWIDRLFSNLKMGNLTYLSLIIRL